MCCCWVSSPIISCQQGGNGPMRQAAVTAADRLDSRQERFIQGCERLRVTPRLSLPKVDIQPNVNHTSVVGGWKRQSMMNTRCIMWGRCEGKWKMMAVDISYHTEKTVGIYICSTSLCRCCVRHLFFDCMLHMTVWSYDRWHGTTTTIKDQATGRCIYDRVIDVMRNF